MITSMIFILHNRLFAHDVIAEVRNAAGGQEVIFLYRNRYQKLKKPMFCVVYGYSNRETTRSFYRVRNFVVHKGGKGKKLTEKRRKKWLVNLRLRSGGAESDNARVCKLLMR